MARRLLGESSGGRLPSGPMHSSIHILVVEDEPFIAQMMADMLGAEGYQVDVAANGRVALEKISGRDYDLILSDLRMPEFDGIRLYRALELLQPNLLRRFLVVSGTTHDVEFDRFLMDTAVPVLTKPFNLEDLQHVVRQLLTRH